MLHHKKTFNVRESGFSLVELMVGLTIGLFATLVIMQVFSVFEGQKRTTSSTADAQTNGTIALMQLQRHLQTAGFGMPMPMADTSRSILKCTSSAATNTFPVVIVDGDNGNAGDTIISRYSTAAAGGGVPIKVLSRTDATTIGMTVDSNIGCNSDQEMTETDYNEQFQDVTDTPAEANSQEENRLMLIHGSQCATAQISEQPTNLLDVSKIKLYAAPTGLPANWESDPNTTTYLSCMGNYGNQNFSVVGSELRLNGDPIVSGVISMQAQYGVSDTAQNNTVTAWVDAAGSWANPSLADRNRIKAIRVAIVLQNGLKEKVNVTTGAPKAWTDSGTSTIDMDVSFVPDWQQYRYRVFGTTVPLRNMIWSREAM